MIDWTPFFQTWELAGRYPKILQDEVVGEAARNLFADAQAMLARIIEEKWLQANAVVGLFPANSVGDDVEVYADESRSEVLTTFHFLRQQMVKPEDRANHCLADLVAPKELRGQGLHRLLRGHRRHRHRSAASRPSRPSTTTTTRSCSRRWPTGWPRPSPS